MHAWGCLVGFSLALTACTESTNGSPFPETAYGWSTGADEGEVFTDGLTVLQNLGQDDLRLQRVRFEDGEPGLELVGARIAGLDRTIGAHQRLPGFPPQSDDLGELEPLEGYLLPAGGEYATRGVELLLGVRKTSEGRATRRALLVTYTVEGEERTTRLVATLAVCEAARAQSCPAEEGAGD